MQRLRVPSLQEHECAGSWSLSSSGRWWLGGRLVGLGVFLAFPWYIHYSSAGLRGSVASIVFSCVMTVFSVAASALLGWDVAHYPTSLRFYSSGVEFKVLWVWRVWVNGSEVRRIDKIRMFDRQVTYVERIRFTRGHFNISPDLFDRYDGLLSCCKKLVNDK